MCECMTKVNESLKGRNTRLATGFTVDNHELKCTLLMATEKVDTKVRGKPMNVLPTFCPFCGVPYSREAEIAAA